MKHSLQSQGQAAAPREAVIPENGICRQRSEGVSLGSGPSKPGKSQNVPDQSSRLWIGVNTPSHVLGMVVRRGICGPWRGVVSAGGGRQ